MVDCKEAGEQKDEKNDNVIRDHRYRFVESSYSMTFENKACFDEELITWSFVQ